MIDVLKLETSIRHSINQPSIFNNLSVSSVSSLFS